MEDGIFGANTVHNVKAYGAVGDGVVDDITAINTAVTAANAEGGVVYFPSGTYRVSKPVGMFNTAWTGYPQTLPTQIVGVTLRGAGYEATTVVADGAFPALAGYFYGSVIEGLTFDEDGNGDSAAVVQLDQTTIQNCRFRGHGNASMIYWWDADYVAGLKVNSGVWDGAGIGYLIRIHKNVIEPPPGARLYAYGFGKTYLMVDSWVTENYIESTEANVVTTGGAVRWIGNHFNGAEYYSTQLNGAIDNTTTSITVDNSSVLPLEPFNLLVENEQCRVTGIAGNVLTVTRGYNGTSAASHGDNTTVYGVMRPRHNILIPYGANYNLFQGNIFEEARESNFKFTADEYMTDLDIGISITDNLFAKGSAISIGTHPAIYISGFASGSKIKGVVIANNIFNRSSNSLFGWDCPVHMKYADEFTIMGNSWYENVGTGPVKAEACGTEYQVLGNGNRNTVVVL
jgi:hypothetical protein